MPSVNEFVENVARKSGKKVYVFCPTKKLFMAVQDRVFSQGGKWNSGDTTPRDNIFDLLEQRGRRPTIEIFTELGSVYILYRDTRPVGSFTATNFLKLTSSNIILKNLVKKLKGMQTAESTKQQKPPRKKQVEIEVFRKDGRTYFRFKIDETLETIFKNHSKGEVKSSDSWKGLKFYYYPAVIDSKKYQELLNDYSLFDDFGHSFVRENRYFNIAFLRTVGGKGEVELQNDIPFAIVSHGLRNMTKFIKEFYQEFLSDYKIKAFVNVEL